MGYFFDHRQMDLLYVYRENYQIYGSFEYIISTLSQQAGLYSEECLSLTVNPLVIYLQYYSIWSGIAKTCLAMTGGYVFCLTAWYAEISPEAR